MSCNCRELLECGHPKACWIHEDSSDPDKRGVFYEKGWCSACAERERLSAEHKACEDAYITELETLRATVQRHSFEPEAEREKVREACCRAACMRCYEGNKPFFNGTNWMHTLERKPSLRTTETWNEKCSATPVHQLDLTQDLAASSREEGGDARDSRD
ncbi:hypothetical protein LCGC14_3094610 [marine sediment metagenome]|uniref:Uncharacterized protein n=1 Tax=marine sediment metagenome TaxID=412755 RepID=A0A0F8W9K9_9ZZZZ